MHALTSLRTLTTAASLTCAGLLAAAPMASAAVGGAAGDVPRVLDHGRTLSVSFEAAGAQSGDPAAARDLASSLVGGWAGALIADAAANAAQQPATCRAEVTAADPDGARGSATVAIPAGTTTQTVALADRTHGTAWAVGDVDHFTVKTTCTDSGHNSRLTEVELDQDAIAGS